MQFFSEVAVIIPTFNHSDKLRIALQSLVDQEYQDWVAVVVNNFSTDNTIEIVNSFSDDRIVCINFSNKNIIAASRNLGILSTHSKYIAFLDSDDYWLRDKLALCIEALERGADWVCHAEYWVDDDRPGTKRLVRYGPESRVSYRRLLFCGNRLSTSAIVAKRSLVELAGMFSDDPRFVGAEDYDLWLNCAAVSSNVVILNEPLGVCRIHNGGISRRVGAHLGAVQSVVRSHFWRPKADLGSRRLLPFRYRRRSAIALYGASRSYFRGGDIGMSYKTLLKSLFEYPSARALYFLLYLFSSAISRTVQK